DGRPHSRGVRSPPHRGPITTTSPRRRSPFGLDAPCLRAHCARPDHCGLYGHTPFALYPLWRGAVSWRRLRRLRLRRGWVWAGWAVGGRGGGGLGGGSVRGWRGVGGGGVAREEIGETRR